jgi:DNA helicase-2/ATP-dependent DNA helicase PcrA
VDEAQDMTRAQLELALRATYENGHVVLCGDDRQAIYGFRGADSGSLDRLKSELSADELGLTVTYRCPKSVVNMARQFVPDYEAAPEAPEGQICERSVDQMLASVQARDFILSRTNAPLAGLCLALIRDGKRAYIRGREIGTGIVAVVRKLKLRDMSDLHSSLTKWTERELARVDRKRKPGDEAKSNAVADLIRDKAAVIEILADGCATVGELIARIESMFQTPKAGEPETRIMLATIHKAKGLEAPNVYTLESTFKRKGGEEDNIRYVAITRSQGGLFLVQNEASEDSLAA